MTNVLVRDIENEVLDRLKQRATVHHRSLQAELKAILEQAASQGDREQFKDLAMLMRRRLHGRRHTDSAELLAEDRAR